ncbi:DUF1127 domain-containing protein [Dongia sp.]|uniref:DUF1127 domain-containing protein n=1 Tax=Dongia sp. TaxID=1977262 RepID=UPI0035B45DE4
MQLLSTINLTLRRWQRYSEVRRELATYTDRELADMGLGRGDIRTIAQEAAAAVVLPEPVARPHFAKVAHS